MTRFKTTTPQTEGVDARRIVRELTARKRNRLFSYQEYVEIMSRGTERPDR